MGVGLLFREQFPMPDELRQDIAYTYAYSIYKEEVNGKYCYCLEDDKFYFYKEGYWKSLFDVEFLGQVQENMKELTGFNISRRKQIVDNFKQLGRKHLIDFNWSTLINMKNGMVNPYDGDIISHDFSFYSTNRLPYIYEQNAKCELWEITLKQIFEDDMVKINVLQEFFGYCLTRETKHHKALLLLGESRSGKSTIIQTLRNIIGRDNCSSVPLKYISNAQYTAMLINKLVNIDTDVSAKAEMYEAEFKTITSGEPVAVNQKYIAAFDFVPYCKIVMAANIFPRITDHSSAFYNRLILLPCDRVFSYEEQNRDLFQQLQQEYPGILNWSIKGLKRLTDRGRFEELDFMKDAIEDLENENNPCNIFFNEHIEVIPNSYIEKHILFERYQEWCRKNEHYPITHIMFSRNLLKKYKNNTPKQSRLNNKERHYVWRNLKYVDFKDDTVQEIEIPLDKTASPSTIAAQGDINWET